MPATGRKGSRPISRVAWSIAIVTVSRAPPLHPRQAGVPTPAAPVRTVRNQSHCCRQLGRIDTNSDLRCSRGNIERHVLIPAGLLIPRRPVTGNTCFSAAGAASPGSVPNAASANKAAAVLKADPPPASAADSAQARSTKSHERRIRRRTGSSYSRNPERSTSAAERSSIVRAISTRP